MSWEAQRWAHEMGKRHALDPGYRLLLIVLACFADKEGNDIYPSIGTLVMDSGLSENTIRRHIKHLTAMGLMEYGNQSAVLKFRAGNRPKVYRLTMSAKPELLRGEKSQAESTHGGGSQIGRSQIGGSQSSPLGGPKRGATVAGKTKNPKEILCATCERLRPASVVDSTDTCADCRDIGPDDAAAGQAFLAQRKLAKQMRQFGAVP